MTTGYKEERIDCLVVVPVSLVDPWTRHPCVRPRVPSLRPLSRLCCRTMTSRRQDDSRGGDRVSESSRRDPLPASGGLRPPFCCLRRLFPLSRVSSVACLSTVAARLPGWRDANAFHVSFPHLMPLGHSFGSRARAETPVDVIQVVTMLSLTREDRSLLLKCSFQRRS